MKIYNNKKEIIYENNLQGEALRKHWINTLNLGWFEYDGHWCNMRGSLIQELGLSSLSKSGFPDIAYHLELAARENNYIEGCNVRPWEVLYGDGIIFLEM